MVHCSQWALVDPTRRPAEESLPHIAKLIAAGSHLAIKQLPRTSDPKKDFRWILVGWDLQCGPQHASTQPLAPSGRTLSCARSPGGHFAHTKRPTRRRKFQDQPFGSMQFKAKDVKRVPASVLT